MSHRPAVLKLADVNHQESIGRSDVHTDKTNTPTLAWRSDTPGRAVRLAMGIKGQRVAVDQSLCRNLPGSAALALGDVAVVGETAVLIAVDRLWSPFSLFPNGNRGMPIGLVHWRDAAYAAVKTGATDSVLAHAQLVARQLHDGRTFLQGDAPSLADVHAAAWMLDPAAQRILGKDHRLGEWCARMRGILDGGTDVSPCDPGILAGADKEAVPVSLEPFAPAGGPAINAALIGRDSDLVRLTANGARTLIASALDFHIQGRETP